ncbi:MAG TPA: hypothetical protein VFK30_12430 [Anaerolineae bacterium]|nr:hypothetical protein [Anaerolineae bacterium]
MSDVIHSGGNHICPNCGSKTQRVHRRPLDRIRSLFVPMKRYHCPKCGWTGLRRSAGRAKGGHNT